MPRGEDTAQLATWFKLVRASVAPRVVAIVCLIGATLALAPLGWLAFYPRAAREHWLLETLLTGLRATPPTDAILAQLPAERLASVHTRLLELIGRMLTPALICASVAPLLLALVYAGLARHLRARWSQVAVVRTAAAPAQHSSRLTFLLITCAAIAAHMPYALLSIRYDEDQTSLTAATGWLNWANNLIGWNNHVAAALTIRLSTALFGLNELAVRMPAVLASSLSLAFLCTFLQRRYSKWLGWTCAATFMALPLWAEQTALARGYGLTFSAAVLMFIGLIRVDEEGDNLSSTTMACLFASVFVGCLAHFYFVFLTCALFVFLFFTPRLSAGVRSAVLWALVMAAILPALSFAFGLPGTFVSINQSGSTTAAEVGQRFLTELSFRHNGALGIGLACLSVALIVVSPFQLPRATRRAYLGLMLLTVCGPLLGQPAFVYPRYFIHASVFIVPCIAWFVSVRLLRDRALPNLIACSALFALFVSTRPWSLPEWVNLRDASRIARDEASARGEHFAADSFLSSGLRFYNGSAGRIVNSMHPIPENVETFLLGVPPKQLRVPEGFEIERRLPGVEHEILLLRRQPALTKRP
jgi:hypothetical protein